MKKHCRLCCANVDTKLTPLANGTWDTRDGSRHQPFAVSKAFLAITWEQLIILRTRTVTEEALAMICTTILKSFVVRVAALVWMNEATTRLTCLQEKL